MVVKSILSRKISFDSFLKNLMLALGITGYSQDFFTIIQKQQKLVITAVLLVRENLKDIGNRSDCIGIATVYCGIALLGKSWMV